MSGVISGGGLLDVFLRGGLLMWPILLCSIVALAFVIERFVSLRSSVVFPVGLLNEVRTLLRERKVDEAVRRCADDPSPFGRLLYACLLRSEASGFEMEAALEEAGSRVLYDLRRNARPLGIIADVSPLLGLMGTVSGMIKAFEVVATAGALGRAEMLAAGIAEALLTTFFGLGVAIPTLLFFQYFRGRADGHVRAMEDECLGLLNELRMSGKKP